MNLTNFEDLLIELIRTFGLHQPEQVPSGLSMSPSELLALRELATDIPLSQQALASRQHLEKSTVSRLIKHLEQRGWITRQRDSHDGRVFLLRLSEQGRQALTEVTQVVAARHEQILSRLAPDEEEALMYGLSALIRALRTP